jgi:hypothetical protein
MRLRNRLAIAVLTAIAAAGSFQAQSADTEAIVDKAADYVADYTRDFVGIVAEESYRQEVRGAPERDPRGFAVDGPRQTRDLKSDVLLVRGPVGERWMQFRDVFEVDGKPIRDRAERLAKLFLEPWSSAQQQVQAITAESARYNIGGISRDVNLPVLALSVLDPENRPWFSFTGRRKNDSVPGGLWELEYREERGRTMIRTNRGLAMPARGKLTVEGGSGRVVATELEADNDSVRAHIGVTYRAESAVGLHMPREMREKYVTTVGSTIEGRATYSKFRRYQVTVDQTLKK